MEEREQTGVSHGSNRERQPHYQLRLFVGYGLQLTLVRLLVLVGHALIYQNMNAHAIWDYVVAPEFIGGPTSLPTGNRAPSGAVIFSRISVFVAKKHSRSILRKMLLECFFDTKTLMREKITAPEGARFPVGRLVARLLPECCIAAWCGAT